MLAMTITDEAWCAIKAKELLSEIGGKRIIDSEEDTAKFLLEFREETVRNYQWWKDNEKAIHDGRIRV